MKSKDFLSDEILKQFKTGTELNDFLKQVQKRGIEKMLEGELDDHLGYEKHEKAPSQNSRNGYGQKKVRTSLGETQIDVPRDRDATFNPMIIPKRGNMVDGIENIIVSLYAKGMSVLTDMKARGVADLLITATDNLNGFTETIRNVFPQATTQICVVHQIRNACRYVVWWIFRHNCANYFGDVVPVKKECFPG